MNLGTKVIHSRADSFAPADPLLNAITLAATYHTPVTRRFPTRDLTASSDLKKAKLVWVETPTNPTLEVCDIAEIRKITRGAGSLLAVDNTTATIIGQNPIALGADLCVSSDTKALTGHSDLVLGHVTARDSAWAEKLRAWRSLTGAVPGPVEIWLAHRSLLTLEMRIERSSKNAMTIAEFLASRGDVESVRFPGLPSDPSHPIATRQMANFGSVIGFTLPTRARAEQFLSACRLVTEATSFGGVHSTAERRARWRGDAIAEGFIRLSVGCEECGDLLQDISNALVEAAQLQ